MKSNLFAAVALAIVATFGFVASHHVGPQQVSAQQSKPSLPASGDLKLDVTGDGIETVIVAKELPFFVSVKKGAALYFWQPPDGATTIENGEKLLVQSIGKGTHVFRVKALAIDWENKKTVTKYGSVTVVVGDVGPGPGPDPGPPGPETQLEKDLTSALSADVATGKGTTAQAGAAGRVFREMASEAKNKSNTAVQDLTRKMTARLKAAVPTGNLPAVEKVLIAYLNQHLKISPSQPLTTEIRERFTTHFGAIADALDKVTE